MADHPGLAASVNLRAACQHILDLIESENWEEVTFTQANIIRLMQDLRAFPLTQEPDLEIAKQMMTIQHEAFNLLRLVKTALEAQRDSLERLLKAADHQSKNGGLGKSITTDTYSLESLGRRKR